MEETLIDAGLTRLQSQTYLFLLDQTQIQPKYLMDKLKISRTNTYKVLDSLEKIGLANKAIINKKTVYLASDPIALANLVAEKRNTVISLEKNVNKAMIKLRSSYNKNIKEVSIVNSSGKDSIISSYEKQMSLENPIYFIKSRADIPFMGFDVMDGIRKKQGILSKERYGITTDSIEASKNVDIDKSTNLTRIWVNESDYTSPVEWSVSGNNIIIQVFDGEGRSISINNELIAESFRQLWQLMNKPINKNSPKNDNREI